MHAIKFCSVLFSIVVDPCCHKQDSLMCGTAAFVDRKRLSMHPCYNLYSTVEMLTTRDGPAAIDAEARYCSKIVIVASVRMSPLKYCHNVWYGKTTRWWKKFEDMFIGFDRQNIRTWQTDRWTDTARRHKSRLCMASRGTNGSGDVYHISGSEYFDRCL